MKKRAAAEQFAPGKPWISMKTGLRVIWIASIGMAVLTAIQVVPERGLVEGIFWGVVFGGMIWLIFWGYYLFHRFLRPK
ncbi:MAG: hypothetical protein GX491_06005 [Chloroflexi bacterium]|nr:hypothetical protein [Chloroflexota bacterium]